MLAKQKFQMIWTLWGSCKIKAFLLHSRRRKKWQQNVVLFLSQVDELTVALLHDAKLVSFYWFLNWWFLFPVLVSCHFRFFSYWMALRILKLICMHLSSVSQGLYKHLILVWCLQWSLWILSSESRKLT